MKVRCLILIAALGSHEIAAFAGTVNYSVSVGINAVVLVPDTEPSSTTTWSNELVVAQGDYVMNTNSPEYVYFAVSPGTSTNMPTHTDGINTTNDAVEWLKLHKRYQEKQRENAIIFADLGTTVYYAKGGKTPTSSASILDTVRPARSFPDYQNEVRGVVSNGTATVNVELDY